MALTAVCLLRRLGICDDAEAIAVAGIDADRVFHAAFAQRAAQRADGPLQGVLGHRHARPEGIEQFVLGDDPLAAADQIGEQIEDAWLQRHLAFGQPQDAARLVEPKRTKFKRQLTISRSLAQSGQDQQMLRPA